MVKINSKIKLALRKLLVSCGSIETDKAVLQYDGDEIVVGTEVFVENEEGEIVAAEDGEYKVEDKTYVVAEGKVTEIREESKEEEVVEVSASKQKFEAIKSAYEETYDEKIQKIYAAIAAVLGHNDFYVREAADDFAVAEVWEEPEGYKDIRYAITWDEEGNAIASDPVEVKEAFVPADEKEQIEEQFEEEPTPAEDENKPEEEVKSTDEKVADLEASLGEIREGLETLTNAIAAVAKRIEAVEEKVGSLEEPAAEPAEEGEETEVKASRLSYLRK